MSNAIEERKLLAPREAAARAYNDLLDGIGQMTGVIVASRELARRFREAAVATLEPYEERLQRLTAALKEIQGLAAEADEPEAGLRACGRIATEALQ